MKRMIEMEGRQFKCEVFIGQCMSDMVECTIKEIIHPERRFFKTEFFGENTCFWLDDFSSVMEGVEDCVHKYLDEKKRNERNLKKIKEFEEST